MKIQRPHAEHRKTLYAQLTIVPREVLSTQARLFTPNARLKCNGLNSPRPIY